MPSPNVWKNEQRELLRAAFPGAFVRYTELAYASGETDDMRKYVEFIAKQLALEEAAPKVDPNAGLTMVQINIGSMHRSVRPAGLHIAPAQAEVVEALPTTHVAEVIQQVVPKAAAQALATVEPPEERFAEFEQLLDSLELA